MKKDVSHASLLRRLFLLLLLISLPNIILYLKVADIKGLVISILFVSSFFLIPIFFFKSYLKTYTLFLIILGLMALLATIPIFYFNLILNEALIQLIINTNYNEAVELMGGYLWVIIIAVLAYLIVAYSIIKRMPSVISQRSTLRISIASMTIVVLMPILTHGLNNYRKNFVGMSYTSFPFYVWYFGKQYVEDYTLLKKHPAFVKNFHFNTHQKRVFSNRQIYLLMIGESSRYDHWRIDGYQRNTSPKLLNESNLIAYKNVCAAGGVTELSVPMLITQTYPKNYKAHIYQKSIVALFGEAGFSTYWISDQIDRGNISMHAKEADHRINLNTNLYINTHNHYDMELICQLDSILKQDTSNLFIVIHTLGSHFNYTKRYSSDFDIFKPSGQGLQLPPNKKELKKEYANGYDNSILYTDAVIDSAIKLIDQKSTISALYYISDHGENLLDDDRQLFSHTPTKPSKYVAHVPLFIFTSDTYNKYFPLKVINLRNHFQADIDGYYTFNTIADIADLDFNNQDLSKSIASDHFKDTVQVILGGDRNIYKFKQLK